MSGFSSANLHTLTPTEAYHLRLFVYDASEVSPLPLLLFGTGDASAPPDASASALLRVNLTATSDPAALETARASVAALR